ncbi:MAG: DUF423 domain-containing protein [Methylococcales bacterium]
MELTTKRSFSQSARLTMLIGIISSALGVAFGAFGAHGLKQLLSTSSLQIYQTGVDYQMWHSLALILIGLSLQCLKTSRLLMISSWLMLSGIILFSGSLYLFAITEIRWLGMITPIGGVSFLIAWILFAIAIVKSPITDHQNGP